VSWLRALAAWLLIVAAETVHGTLRQLFLVPAIGELPARQVGVLVGSLIIFVVAWLTIRWIGARTLGQQLAVGAVWLVLIVAFEFALGSALGYSRARILEDYDFGAGGYMGLGLLFLLLAPSLAARVRGFGPGA
jgi:hypothetical protein